MRHGGTSGARSSRTSSRARRAMEIVERDDGLHAGLRRALLRRAVRALGRPGRAPRDALRPRPRARRRLRRGTRLPPSPGSRARGRRHRLVAGRDRVLPTTRRPRRARARARRVDGTLGAFDTIVFLGQNLGMLGSRTRARRLLRRLAALTTERGRIVAETFDPHRLDEPVHRRYRARTAAAGACRASSAYASATATSRRAGSTGSRSRRRSWRSSLGGHRLAAVADARRRAELRRDPRPGLARARGRARLP